MENILQVHHLKKYYENDMKAVDDISFSVSKGELFGFLGVNGAGKSTTIKMLCTLLKPTSGEISICGKRIGTDDAEIRKRTGVVWQNNCLDEALTVSENLNVRGSLYGCSGIRLKEQINKVMQDLELQEIINRKYGKLSGGQKRKCELAAALLHSPDILFLDEPTTGLDPATRKLVWASIGKFRKKGMTVFLTTHYMEEAAEADHIAIMDSGKILIYGTPHELKSQYASDRLVMYYKDGKMTERFINNSLDSIAPLVKEKQKLEGFEVIAGKLDDVFLNVTGKGLEKI